MTSGNKKKVGGIFFLILFSFSFVSAKTYTQDYNNFLTRSITDYLYCKIDGSNCNISSSSGNISNIISGDMLTGGGSDPTVTLNIDRSEFNSSVINLGSRLNTNSSGYWDNINTPNATQMEENNGVLTIIPSGLEYAFLKKDGSNADTQVNLQDENLTNVARLGVGVSSLSPGYTVEVDATGHNYGLVINNAPIQGVLIKDDNFPTRISAATYGGFGDGAVFAGIRTDGSEASPSALFTGRDIFEFQGLGAYESSSNLYQGLAILGEADETWTASARGSRWTFQATGTGSTTLTNAFKIVDFDDDGTPDAQVSNGNLDVLFGDFHMSLFGGDKIIFDSFYDHANMGSDGTNFFINSTSGTVQILNDSGFGIIEYGMAIDHTTPYDESRGPALDNLPDFDSQINADGTINHTALGSFCAVDTWEADYSRPVETERCFDGEDEEPDCRIIVEYPHKKLCKDCGINVGCINSLNSKALVESKSKREELENEISLLKSELCKKDISYAWCVSIT